jgi:hypothetical protein
MLVLYGGSLYLVHRVTNADNKTMLRIDRDRR